MINRNSGFRVLWMTQHISRPAPSLDPGPRLPVHELWSAPTWLPSFGNWPVCSSVNPETETYVQMMSWKQSRSKQVAKEKRNPDWKWDMRKQRTYFLLPFEMSGMFVKLVDVSPNADELHLPTCHN